MTRSRRALSCCVAVLVLGVASGCTYTVAGTRLSPLTPPSPSFQPRVEHTVGDFSFTLEGGKIVTSYFAGCMLNGDIMASWKKRGYVVDARPVEHGAFSGTSDYEVTLTGTQYGESSIAMQILSGLTLLLLPSSVTQHYDVQYIVKDVKRGTTSSASVQEDETSYVELFLLFALPIGQRGHHETMERMGDHLYEQLHRQGLFQSGAPAAGE